MRTEDYYELLGVGRNATQLDIENAYEYFKTLDKSGQIDQARWEKVQEAYKVLSSAKNRMLYDEVLKQNDTAPGASFSAMSNVPVIDQSSAMAPETSSNSLAVGIAAVVVIFLAVIGVMVAFLAEDSPSEINSGNSAIIIEQATPPTGIPTLNVPDEGMSLPAEFADWQRCQVTNTTTNPVTIYDAMDDASGLSIFLMMEQPIEIFRDTDTSDWYVINPDQVVAAQAITGSTNEAMPHGNFLQSADVQLDFCFED